MGALGCQLAVSLMVINSEIKQGMQSTRILAAKQILHDAQPARTPISDKWAAKAR
ncbi:hypothetical protein SMATCC274_02970 [Serratia marcescens]|nr:hypothetical protein SMATCC274_02970 [Serratia marcescens]